MSRERNTKRRREKESLIRDLWKGQLHVKYQKTRKHLTENRCVIERIRDSAIMDGLRGIRRKEWELHGLKKIKKTRPQGPILETVQGRAGQDRQMNHNKTANHTKGHRNEKRSWGTSKGPGRDAFVRTQGGGAKAQVTAVLIKSPSGKEREKGKGG